MPIIQPIMEINPKCIKDTKLRRGILNNLTIMEENIEELFYNIST
jgi:hypothetical protein